uniref:histidine kinase n=1 Tax=Tanacetum cinerariifolium TaxID=118510 RepID=A0A699GJD9_TANCI|nr:two-component sensor protein histidine protein kinase, putative [Tanacetum cinerariifolium]
MGWLWLFVPGRARVRGASWVLTRGKTLYWQTGAVSDRSMRSTGGKMAEREAVVADDMGWLSGGGEMGELIRSMDWSTTPLGPVSGWPQSLRTSVSLCLSSTFPMLVAWGPEDVQIYNDAYRPICGAKHPESMGEPFKICWATALPVVGDAFDRAHAGEGVYIRDQRMMLDRYGYLEEAFMTFSFSPIRAESGNVGGIFHPISEGTAAVLDARRTQNLRDLTGRIALARTADELAQFMVYDSDTLAMDLPFMMLYELAPDGVSLHLRGCVGLPQDSALAPPTVALDDRAGWDFSTALADGGNCRVDDLQGSFGDFDCAPYEEAPHTAMVMPLAVAGQERPYGFLVGGVSARRALDDAYLNFYELLRGAFNTAIGNVLAYEQEQKRAAALAEIDKAKTAFFSNVSHEFRTPLTLILGPLEDALADTQDALSPRQRDRIDLTNRNALRLLKLVNSLLDFSRIEAGRVQARFAPVDLAQLTANLASVFEAAMDKAGLAYDIETDPLSEPVFVDLDMWEKVVFNLLSNAFKFTIYGGVTVRLRQTATGARLTVRDTGGGIPPAELPRVFERFHRVEGVQGRSYEGTGIGLALIQELVRLHGGSIAVESRLGAGSTFTVDIPFGSTHLPPQYVVAQGDSMTGDRMGSAFVEEALRWLPDAAQAASASASPVVAPATSAQPPAVPLPAQRARILIADDNQDMRGYVRSLLERDYVVETCADGQDALESVRRNPPDLLLSDVMMPRLDGFALLKTIRAEVAMRHVPVILLSARAGEEARIEGLEAGADDYMVKPFSANELQARVRSHIELARERKQSNHELREREEYFRSLVNAPGPRLDGTDPPGRRPARGRAIPRRQRCAPGVLARLPAARPRWPLPLGDRCRRAALCRGRQAGRLHRHRDRCARPPHPAGPLCQRHARQRHRRVVRGLAPGRNAGQRPAALPVRAAGRWPGAGGPVLPARPPRGPRPRAGRIPARHGAGRRLRGRVPRGARAGPDRSALDPHDRVVAARRAGRRGALRRRDPGRDRAKERRIRVARQGGRTDASESGAARVPGDAGARAAQPAGADPQRPGNDARARSGAGGAGTHPRHDGTAGGPSGASGGRPAGPGPHRARQGSAGAGRGRPGDRRAQRGGTEHAAAAGAPPHADHVGAGPRAAAVARCPAHRAGDRQSAQQRCQIHARRRRHRAARSRERRRADGERERQRRGHSRRGAGQRVRHVHPGAGQRGAGAGRARYRPQSGAPPDRAPWRQGQRPQRGRRSWQHLYAAPAGGPAVRPAGGRHRGAGPAAGGARAGGRGVRRPFGGDGARRAGGGDGSGGVRAARGVPRHRPAGHERLRRGARTARAAGTGRRHAGGAHRLGHRFGPPQVGRGRVRPPPHQAGEFRRDHAHDGRSLAPDRGVDGQRGQDETDTHADVDRFLPVPGRGTGGGAAACAAAAGGATESAGAVLSAGAQHHADRHPARRRLLHHQENRRARTEIPVPQRAAAEPGLRGVRARRFAAGLQGRRGRTGQRQAGDREHGVVWRRLRRRRRARRVPQTGSGADLRGQFPQAAGRAHGRAGEQPHHGRGHAPAPARAGQGQGGGAAHRDHAELPGVQPPDGGAGRGGGVRPDRERHAARRHAQEDPRQIHALTRRRATALQRQARQRRDDGGNAGHPRQRDDARRAVRQREHHRQRAHRQGAEPHHPALRGAFQRQRRRQRQQQAGNARALQPARLVAGRGAAAVQRLPVAVHRQAQAREAGQRAGQRGVHQQSIGDRVHAAPSVAMAGWRSASISCLLCALTAAADLGGGAGRPMQQVGTAGQGIQYRQRGKQRAAYAEQHLPHAARRPRQRQHGGAAPRREEPCRFHGRPFGQSHRHQAVGPEIGGNRDRYAGNRAQVQAIDQAQAEARAAAPGQCLGIFLALLHGPQQQAGGHHRAAGQAGDEEQRPQPGAGEARRMQADHHALRGGGRRCLVRGRRNWRAGHAVEDHGRLVGRHVLAVAAIKRHRGVGLPRMVDHDAAHAAFAPGCRRLREQRRQRRERGGHARGLGVGLHGLAQLREEFVAFILVHRLHAPRHVHEHQRDDAGVRDHQVVGQGQYGAHVVRVEPRTLALGGTEGEEILEDALVRDNARQDRHQHKHGADAHDPARPQHRHVMQVKVHAIEEFAAARGARCALLFAGGRIEGGVAEAPAARPVPGLAGLIGRRRRPHGAQRRFALAGKGDEPAVAPGRAALEEGRRAGGGLGLRHLASQRLMDLGLHPQRNLVLVIRGGTGAEHQEQDPAGQQTGPGVQPRHRLAQSLFHAAPPAR